MIGRNSSASSSLERVAAASGSTRSSRRGSTCSLIRWIEASKPSFLRLALLAGLRLAVGEARHGVGAALGGGLRQLLDVLGIERLGLDRRELVAALRGDG